MNKFLDEIKEQPQALTDTLRYYLEGEGKNQLENVSLLWKSGRYTKMIFTGMGSSFFISQAAAAMLARQGLPAFAINAGELLHQQCPVVDKHTLLFCMSQSGESYEIVNLIEKLPKGTTVVGITNQEDSTLVKLTCHRLLCRAGTEYMTSTKTFICCYLITYLLAAKFEVSDPDVSVLNKLSGNVADILANADKYVEACKPLLVSMPFVQLIARGTDFAGAAQSALMFMEATKTPASAMLGGEFRHGPLEMVSDGFAAIVIANHLSGTYTQSLRLVDDILKFGGRVILIADKPSHLNHSKLVEFNIDNHDALLFVISAIIPIQLIVNYLAEKKNLTPGDFTHGAKVTAIE